MKIIQTLKELADGIIDELCPPTEIHLDLTPLFHVREKDLEAREKKERLLRKTYCDCGHFDNQYATDSNGKRLCRACHQKKVKHLGRKNKIRH